MTSGEDILGERLLEQLGRLEPADWLELIREWSGTTPEQWAREYVDRLVQGLEVVPDLRLGTGQRRRRWLVEAAKEADIALLAYAVRVALKELEELPAAEWVRNLFADAAADVASSLVLVPQSEPPGR